MACPPQPEGDCWGPKTPAPPPPPALLPARQWAPQGCWEGRPGDRKGEKACPPAQVALTWLCVCLRPAVLGAVQHVPDHQGPAGAADKDPAGQHPVAAGRASQDPGAALLGPGLQRPGEPCPAGLCPLSPTSGQTGPHTGLCTAPTDPHMLTEPRDTSQATYKERCHLPVPISRPGTKSPQGPPLCRAHSLCCPPTFPSMRLPLSALVGAALVLGHCSQHLLHGTQPRQPAQGEGPQSVPPSPGRTQEWRDSDRGRGQRDPGLAPPCHPGDTLHIPTAAGVTLPQRWLCGILLSVILEEKLYMLDLFQG